MRGSIQHKYLCVLWIPQIDVRGRCVTIYAGSYGLVAARFINIYAASNGNTAVPAAGNLCAYAPCTIPVPFSPLAIVPTHLTHHFSTQPAKPLPVLSTAVARSLPPITWPILTPQPHQTEQEEAQRPARPMPPLLLKAAPARPATATPRRPSTASSHANSAFRRPSHHEPLPPERRQPYLRLPMPLPYAFRLHVSDKRKDNQAQGLCNGYVVSNAEASPCRPEAMAFAAGRTTGAAKEQIGVRTLCRTNKYRGRTPPTRTSWMPLRQDW